MKNLIEVDFNRPYIKILIITVLFSLTITSCRDSSTLSSEPDQRANLEEILAKKLGPGVSTEEAWGITMQEFEAAYYATYNQVRSTSQSLPALASDSPSVWEFDYGTGLNQGDDDCDLVEIGFPFTFYGKTYTELWVNSNGNLTFNDCNTRFWPTDIPDVDKNVIIGPLYGDFNPSESGDVFVNVVGTEPNRTFVVTWSDVPAWNWPGINTFQAQLAEGTNAILFGYNGLTTNGINNVNGSKMNVGISADPVTFINSASGEEIPELDMTNICYVLEGGEYKEIPCGNTPPVAVAGPDQTVECAGESTVVSLDGSGSSDPDEDTISYSWNLNGNEIATGAAPTVHLPMGSHTISLTVTDPFEASHSDEVIVNIVDTTPPELTYTVNTTRLWPPNGDMHLSVSGISASDVCDPNPSLLVTVTDSGFDGPNGNNNNWNIVENDDGTIDVYLRAEKSNGNSGRIYSIIMISEDASGNVTEETVEVTVPKSNRGNGRNTNRGTGRNNN